MVDDDKEVRSAFRFALDDTPCELTLAASGEEALALLKASAFDLVVTDLKMPGVNGIELLAEIRKLDKRVPITVITAFSQEIMAELERAKQAGCEFELMLKPLRRSDIRDVVASAQDIEFDSVQAGQDTQVRFVLRLYIAGENPSSQRTINQLEKICEGQLAGHCSLEIIDIFKNLRLAADDKIIATPTLVKKLPEPVSHHIGDLSDTEKVLSGLGIKKRGVNL